MLLEKRFVAQPRVLQEQSREKFRRSLLTYVLRVLFVLGGASGHLQDYSLLCRYDFVVRR